jgi:nitrite reductase/ring-hydroxylating ferredoxin subunit
MPWTYAATLSELAAREVIGIGCEGRRLALYRLDDEVFATSDVCPHQGASLADGCVVQGFIECPLHFALFDIRTGEADGAMTTRAVRTYPTRVKHGAIYVDLSDAEESAS